MDADMGTVNPAFQNKKRTDAVSAVPGGQYAITVRNAHVHYQDVLGALFSGNAPTTNVVLKDFNMSVKKGHIYGLLGASGCGKTSILRAIVGQLELTAGEIRVLGHAPGTPQSGIPGATIGYMPQGLSLMEEFSIKELLYFYGQLVGMSSDQITAKCDYFVKLLDLPKPNRIVETLSGGQKRRVSFAIALLHSPPILVLDEPTVGVDSLLRESIWEYLWKMAKTESTTVLITTHYIEEASRADTVGLLRHGKLMREENPQSLMESLQCHNLEDALVRLCVLQQSTNENPISHVNDSAQLPALRKVDEDVENTETSTWVNKKVSPFKRIRAMAWKNAVSLRRHYGFLLFTHLLPTMCNYLFGSSYGRPPHGLTISVVNHETNCFTSGLLAPNSYGYENRTNCEDPYYLSCRILEMLQKKDVSLVTSKSTSSAENDVRRGRSLAVLLFPKNFTSAMIERAGYASPHDAEDHVIDTGSLAVTMDDSDVILSFFLRDNIFSALKQALGDETAACDTFRHMKDLPMQYNPPIYGGQETGFAGAAMPASICSLALMTPLVVTLSIMLQDKTKGSLERGLVTGLTMTEVLIGYFIVGLLPTLNVIIILILLPYVIFGFGMYGSYWTLFLMMFLLAVNGMLLGFVFALLSNSFTAAFLLGVGFYFTCLFTSGTIWPIQGVFPYLRGIFWIFPMTFSSEAIRDVTVRGWSVYHSSIQLGVVAPIVWCLVYTGMIYSILRFKVLQ